MPWMLATLAFVTLCFFGALALCEWLVKRRRDKRDSDRDSFV